MTGYKKSIPARPSPSEAKTALENSVKINITETFRESEDVSVHKGKAENPKCDVRAVLDLRRHCDENRHGSVVHIWALPETIVWEGSS